MLQPEKARAESVSILARFLNIVVLDYQLASRVDA
jgi:hypothetical protein